MLMFFLKFVVITSVIAQAYANGLKTLQRNHRAPKLSNADIRHVAGLSDIKYTNKVLDNILIPRVVGTSDHENVFNYIKKELQRLGWTMEVDEFEARVPKFEMLTFRNIIASLNPNADRYLTLACHYDSKYFEKDVFVGATDSAVPCAMMLNLAKVMNKGLSTVKDNSGLSLKLVFFDGEEAFKEWGPDDSIYGAKHLAQLYQNTKKALNSTGELVSELEKIDILLLLDLIGHKRTRFLSSFSETENWYLRLVEAEDRLNSLKLLKYPGNHRYFLKRAYFGYIEDDHIPFLQRNVPILHLISNPFPDEWHTTADNREIVEDDVVEDINKILRVFVAEYLNMLVTNQ